jgi:hypothetical protein
MLDKNLGFPTVHDFHIPEDLFLYLKAGRAVRTWSPGLRAIEQCRPVQGQRKSGRTVSSLEKKRVGGILGQGVQVANDSLLACGFEHVVWFGMFHVKRLVAVGKIRSWIREYGPLSLCASSLSSSARGLVNVIFKTAFPL